MKRKALLKYLKQNDCEFVREGGRHSWWINKKENKICEVKILWN